MSAFEQLQLLKEAMAYCDSGINYAYQFFVEHLYTNRLYVDLYTLELAMKMAEQYKGHLQHVPNLIQWEREELSLVIDFIKDNHSGEKDV